jgi:hypothetical protein
MLDLLYLKSLLRHSAHYRQCHTQRANNQPDPLQVGHGGRVPVWHWLHTRQQSHLEQDCLLRHGQVVRDELQVYARAMWQTGRHKKRHHTSERLFLLERDRVQVHARLPDPKWGLFTRVWSERSVDRRGAQMRTYRKFNQNSINHNRANGKSKPKFGKSKQKKN